MLYREYLPDVALQDVVACYWKFVAPSDIEAPFEHTAPPDGCVSLLFYHHAASHSQYLLLVGPSAEILRTNILPGSVYVGVRFLPGALACFFDIDAASLRDHGQVLPNNSSLSVILPEINIDFNDFSRLDHQLLQMKKSIPDPEVQKAVQMIWSSQGQIKIKDIVRQAFVSERPLQKRFRKAVGLSMKEFARVRRMRTAIVQMVLHQHQSLELSLNGGYYDQAHFLHDFQAFDNMKPGDLQVYLRQIDHGDSHW
ncbi:MAG: helix-turn-helix domain-containing protein [Saprospiraceae bacterium]|nr:helix-turn-helix domain-containing protein [Saprospiraceae bacterium]